MTIEIPETATPNDAAKIARRAASAARKADALLATRLKAAQQAARNEALKVLLAFHYGRPESWEKLDPKNQRFCGKVDDDSGAVTVSTIDGSAEVDLLCRPAISSVFECVAGVFAISAYYHREDRLCWFAVGACEGVFGCFELPEAVGAWLNNM